MMCEGDFFMDRFVIYPICMLLFSWKKSNQKFKAAPASLLRILRSLSPPKLAALKQRMLRTLSTAAAFNAHQLRPFKERFAFSCDDRYCLLKPKAPVILYRCRYRQSLKEAELPRKGLSGWTSAKGEDEAVKKIRCLSAASFGFFSGVFRRSSEAG